MDSPLEMISPVPLSRVFCDLRSAIVHRFLIAKRDTVDSPAELKATALTAHQIHHTSERRKFFIKVAPLGHDA